MWKSQKILISSLSQCQELRQRKFTEEEDEKLIQLVEMHERDNWVQVSKDLNNDFTVRQCKDRFNYYVDPAINKGKLTVEEENTRKNWL